jgi:hypothetical protein
MIASGKYASIKVPAVTTTKVIMKKKESSMFMRTVIERSGQLPEPPERAGYWHRIAR